MAAVGAALGLMTGALDLGAAILICAITGLLAAVIPPYFSGEMYVWKRDWGREGVHASVLANIVVALVSWPLIAVSLIFVIEPTLSFLGLDPIFTRTERLVAPVLWAVIFGLGLIERWILSRRY